MTNTMVRVIRFRLRRCLKRMTRSERTSERHVTRPSTRHLTTEQQERQAALNRSWEAMRRDMADPEMKASLVAAIDRLHERLNSDTPPPTLTREEFLALGARHDANR